MSTLKEDTAGPEVTVDIRDSAPEEYEALKPLDEKLAGQLGNLLEDGS